MSKIYVMNRNHQMRGVLEIYGEPESPKEKAYLIYLFMYLWTRDLSHKPQIESEANLSNSKPSNLRTSELSNKLSNFQTSELSKIETVQSSKVQIFKVSNSQTSKADRTRPRQEFEV